MDKKISNVSMAFWLGEHPILKEKKRTKREKYMGCLIWYTPEGVSRLTESMLALYRKRILGDEDFEAPLSPSIKGLFRYRFALCMDLWFLNALDDKERALSLLERLEAESGLAWMYKKKLRLLWERLYVRDNGARFAKVEPLIERWQKNRLFFQKPAKKILFTANMSAGKSTLINALIGKKVNKSQSMACTAKLHYIWNKAFEDGLTAEDDNVLNLDANYMTLMTDDAGNESSKISVGTYFRLMCGQSGPLCLQDTPGVNSALDEVHGRITKEAVEKGDFDRLVYVVNAGAIATNDEHAYMTYLAETRGKEPMVFAVNKLDGFRAGEDSISGSLEGIREDIRRLGFENAVVCPVSAYAGYLAKKALFDGGLEEEEQDELDVMCRIFRRKEYDLSAYYPREVKEVCEKIAADQADLHRQKYVRLLLQCGILPLEYILTKSEEQRK